MAIKLNLFIHTFVHVISLTYVIKTLHTEFYVVRRQLANTSIIDSTNINQ